jgi:circadian clock protein KaiC
MRNAKSIGIDLAPWVKKGLLHFNVARPTYSGLEMHLVTVNKLIKEFRPTIAVIDPITGLTNIGTEVEVKAMLMRLIDMLKNSYITTLCTSLTHGGHNLEQTEIAVTSLMDTWLLVRDIEYNGERTRGLYVLKSRGMAHSNQIREFLITNKGIDLTDVYIGQGMVLTGSARKVQEMKEEAEAAVRKEELERVKRELERKRLIMEARINEVRSEYESAEEELLASLKEQQMKEKARVTDSGVIAAMRKADKLKAEKGLKSKKNRGEKR